MSELPEYVCHKRVRGGYVLRIEATMTHPEPQGPYRLYLAANSNSSEVIATRDVDSAWMFKNRLSHEGHGGYFVEYADGYTSWSPTTAFEEGYTRVGE